MGTLTDRAVKAAEIGRHGDGDGLYLEVRAASRGANRVRKSWLFRFQMDGTRRAQGLGSYPEVSLAEARQKATERRAAVAKGVDPIEARKAAEQANTSNT
jgi:hypothetical protein